MNMKVKKRFPYNKTIIILQRILLFHVYALMPLIFQIRLYQAHDMTVGLRKNETLYDFEYFFNKEQAKA